MYTNYIFNCSIYLQYLGWRNRIHAPPGPAATREYRGRDQRNTVQSTRPSLAKHHQAMIHWVVQVGGWPGKGPSILREILATNQNNVGYSDWSFRATICRTRQMNAEFKGSPYCKMASVGIKPSDPMLSQKMKQPCHSRPY